MRFIRVLLRTDFERLYRLLDKLNDRKKLSLVFGTCGLAVDSLGTTKRLHSDTEHKC